MKPHLDILPRHQRQLWPELSQVQEYFVLYGGTAIALQLANRQSVDFDFFTERPISADGLARDLPFLEGARLLQAQPNTATFSVRREGEIKVSFFGALTFGRVGLPERCEDNGLWVASLLDLAVQKVKVILRLAKILRAKQLWQADHIRSPACGIPGKIARPAQVRIRSRAAAHLHDADFHGAIKW